MTNPILPFVVLGISVVAQLMRASTHVVGVVIATTLIGLAAYPFVAPKLQSPPNPAIGLVEREHKEALVPAIETPNYQVSKVPTKGYRYLKQNADLMDLIHRLRIVRMFDRPRYQELILTLNHFQRCYIYILGKRTSPKQGVPLFYDLRDRCLSLMYSFYFVVPMQLKQVYGINPHKRIEECITKFAGLASKMNSILRDFTRLELNQHWTYADDVAAANQHNEKHALP